MGKYKLMGLVCKTLQENGYNPYFMDNKTRFEVFNQLVSKERLILESRLTSKYGNDIIILPTSEYKEFESIIRTKYANKIPLYGWINLSNYSYNFVYNKKDDEIICKEKIKI